MPQLTAPTTQAPYNLDDDAAFNVCAARLKQTATENFIVRFDSAEAVCAVDVGQDEALRWLQPGNRTESQALWLNFWASESQRATVEAIAKKYDLSPRLTGLLFPARSSAIRSRDTPSMGSGTSSASDPKDAPTTQTTDVEKGVSQTRPLQRKPTGLQALKGMTFGDVVKDLWHFCSVDFGRHFIYVGFNALYSVPDSDVGTAGDGAESPGRNKGNTSKPSGERIWTSLLICDDGTMVSVFERPVRPEAHETTRRNVRNIFRHLSKQHNQDNSQDALMKVRVRWNEHSAHATTGYDPNEAASLLFYYLFEDWLSTYALIARVEHPYRERLENMRQRMFDAAEVSLIQEVHDVGRQLTVLKLMYQSYELIVSRLLYRQRSNKDVDVGGLSPRSTSHSHNIRIVHDTAASQLAQDEHVYLDEGSDLSVKLSLSAVVRFERLLDRIRLYALTEIEECLKEKESLVFMVGHRCSDPRISC